jgi:hypothetical protein
VTKVAPPSTRYRLQGSVQNGAKLIRVWDGFLLEEAIDFSPGFQTLIIIHNFVGGKAVPSTTIDCLEKHRSPVRTKYRLEAYATLRRRVVAVVAEIAQDVLERSLDTPESNVV